MIPRIHPVDNAGRLAAALGAAVEALRSGRLVAFPTDTVYAVSYTHLRAHETVLVIVCRLLLEKKKNLSLIHHLRCQDATVRINMIKVILALMK